MQTQIQWWYINIQVNITESFQDFLYIFIWFYEDYMVLLVL